MFCTDSFESICIKIKSVKFEPKPKDMDLQLKDKVFIVGGAGDGFGKAVTLALAEEGASVLAVSRTQKKLEQLKQQFPGQIEFITGDITTEGVQDEMVRYAIKNSVSGVFVNAGGPPAGGHADVTMEQWDEAWRTVVRWKIALMNKLLPLMQEQKYGRVLFLESVSVKQPVNQLILSNTLRPAVVGHAKTIAREVASDGITVNVLAPGYHHTAAMERLFKKKSEIENISMQEAQKQFEAEIPVGEMGRPEEMTGIALWLLSPLSRYVTGQTITHDGGIVQGLFG
jgi:3-oxoacyl-[acyl-carrier protein] reductase